MPAHGREVHDALNKARHGCERRRDVRRPCLVSAQCLWTPADAGEVHDAKDNERHACGRPRVVSGPCPVSRQFRRANRNPVSPARSFPEARTLSL